MSDVGVEGGEGEGEGRESERGGDSPSRFPVGQSSCQLSIRPMSPGCTLYLGSGDR
jgi:hypothetical protein